MLKKQSNITVNFKKLSKKAVIPSYAHPTDAGMDLVATSMTVTDKFVEYGLGISSSIPEGFVGLIFPNSRISKYDLSQANCVGVIDSCYRGEWKIRFKVVNKPIVNIVNTVKGWFGIKNVSVESNYTIDGSKLFQVGDVVGQLIVLPYPKVEAVEVSDLDETDRGDGGFGSTAKITDIDPVVTAEPAQPSPVTEEPKKKSRKRKKKE